MTINQKTNSTQRVPVNTINTIIEQISDLQEDLGDVKQEVNGLSTSVDTINLNVTGNATIADLIVNSDLEANHATINNLGGTNVDVAKVTASNIEGNKLVGNLIETTVLDVAETGYFGEIEVSSDTKLTDVEARDITANKIKANQTEASEAKVTNALVAKEAVVENGLTVTGLTDLEDVKADSLTVDGNVEVGNLDVIGGLSITGTFNTDNINATNVMAETLYADETIIAGNSHLVPTPSLDNNDTYTIELPVFTGTLLLVWKEGDATIWSAVVSGNGNDYSISWSSLANEITVTNLFQWNKKLYIRTNANGSLYYSSNTTSEIDEINIYYNMVGWAEEKSLEELCGEKYQYVCRLNKGNLNFGTVYASQFINLGKDSSDNGPAIQYVDELPVEPDNAFYGVFHSYEDVQTVNKTPIDLVGSYFTLVSNGKYKLDDIYTITYNNNEVGSIFISGTTAFLYTSRDFTGLYAETLVTSTAYDFTVIETVDHYDYYAGNKENADYTKIANVDQVEDFFIRKTQKGTAGGVATLDTNGKVPVEELPETLVYEDNLKTINGESLLGNDDIVIKFVPPVGSVLEFIDSVDPNELYPETTWMELE